MTEIRPCSCASRFQDERYGIGRRLMNDGSDKFRCTVCGKEQATPKKVAKKDEKKS